MKRLLSCAVTALVATTAIAADVTFTSVWKTPAAFEVSLAGKKVAALVISKDESLRVAGEEALARELTNRGMQGIATYRMAPREELASAETAKPWFERSGVEGIVALRPVSSEKRTAYTVETWADPYYSSLWGYYGYGWGNVYVVGSARQETVVTVETTIYSVPRNTLLWAGASETTDAKGLTRFIEALAIETVKELHKVGLAQQIKK
jgi:hypothetical protein